MAIKSETETKWTQIESAYNTDEIDVCRDGFNVLLRVFEKYRKDLPPEEATEADAAVSSVREFFQTVVTSSAGVVRESRIAHVALPLVEFYQLEKVTCGELPRLLEKNGLLNAKDIMWEVGNVSSETGYSERLSEAVYDEIDKHLSQAIEKGLETGLLQKRGTSLKLEKDELSL